MAPPEGPVARTRRQNFFLFLFFFSFLEGGEAGESSYGLSRKPAGQLKATMVAFDHSDHAFTEKISTFRPLILFQVSEPCDCARRLRCGKGYMTLPWPQDSQGPGTEWVVGAIPGI